MSNDLVISPTLSLPVDVATSTMAILAKKRAGKSNAAVKTAEEMYRAGVPFVTVDPKGDWWGMRSSADGKHDGIPLIVFGGRHADVPLEPTAGAMIADLVLANRLTCILDVSEFSKADTIRFLTAFGDRLYRQATNEPMHVFLEEAHEYMPQRVMGDEARMVAVWQKLVKQGGFKGIGVTLISQRSASLNKDVLTQADTLIVLRTTSPQDRAAVKAWVDVHMDSSEMLAELPFLADGEAWIWSPGALDLFRKFRFYRRATFDSGETPKVGAPRRQPTKLADIDLSAIQDAMKETIEKAKDNDPAELRKRIKELERTITTNIRETPLPVTVIEQVEVLEPFIPPVIADDIDIALQAMQRASAAVERFRANPSAFKIDKGTRLIHAPKVQVSTPKVAPLPRATSSVAPDKIGKTERNVLTVLVQHGPLTSAQIALLAGYSAKASTIGIALANLRKQDFVSANGQPVVATQRGIEFLGDLEPLPQGAELLEYWRNRFGKTERNVLDAIIAGNHTQADVANHAGYSPGASTVGIALAKLRKSGVINGWFLSDEFVRAIA